MEQIYSVIAFLAYISVVFVILKFTHGGKYHRGYAWLATLIIACCLAQAVHILFLKDPVTIWDAFFSVFLAVVIGKHDGNIAKIFWSNQHDSKIWQ